MNDNLSEIIISSEASQELSRRSALKVFNEIWKVIFPAYGIASDAIQSLRKGELHVSQGTALGLFFRLPSEGNPIIEPPLADSRTTIGEAGLKRLERQIDPFITDYLPDESEMSFEDRVTYYRNLKELGMTNIRTEFRMKDLLSSDEQSKSTAIYSYIDTLRAMTESGMKLNTLVLFTPNKDQIKMLRDTPDLFYKEFRKFTQLAIAICKESGVEPTYIQVMNEVNAPGQIRIDPTVAGKLIRETKQIAWVNGLKSKIMTTVMTDIKQPADLVMLPPDKPLWQAYTKTLIRESTGSLDALGFDYYPFQEHPVDFLQKPFDIYRDIDQYRWIMNEKENGVLEGLETMITEIGAIGEPIMNERNQRLAYNIIFRKLDHVLLEWQERGHKAEELFSQIGIFVGGDLDAVQTKFPYGIDFHPFALMKQDSDGKWNLTEAGKRLKMLLHTRINNSVTY